MIDAIDRPQPRFSESEIDAVANRVEKQLEAWKVGAEDLAICGGACGADLIFADLCRRRGARLRLMLALEVREFLEKSVRRPGSSRDWVGLFADITADKAFCEVLIQPHRLGPLPPDDNAFARANRWMINTASVEAGPQSLYAVLVWDQKNESDGAGGTAHFESEIRSKDGEVCIINPALIP